MRTSGPWEQIDHYFKTNTEIQPTLQEVTEECIRDQIYGVSTIYIATIEKLLLRQSV